MRQTQFTFIVASNANPIDTSATRRSRSTRRAAQLIAGADKRLLSWLGGFAASRFETPCVRAPRRTSCRLPLSDTSVSPIACEACRCVGAVHLCQFSSRRYDSMFRGLGVRVSRPRGALPLPRTPSNVPVIDFGCQRCVQPHVCSLQPPEATAPVGQH